MFRRMCRDIAFQMARRMTDQDINSRLSDDRPILLKVVPVATTEHSLKQTRVR
jgi:hypothetical protein